MRQGSKTKLFFAFLILLGVGIWTASYFYYRGSLAGVATESTALVSSGVAKDGVPAIAEPDFERPAVADQYLNNDGLGLDVEVDGDHRFYPYQLLVWHEAVNDEFNGTPLVVTFSPLTFTGRIFLSTVSGRTLTFGTSEMVWNNGLVLYDKETDSLWSQTLAQSIQGEYSGTNFESYPAHIMRWQDWKNAYPDGEVLSRETGFERDYTRDPYGNYYETNTIFFPLEGEDTRMPLKELVYGIIQGDAAKAYPASIVEGQDRIDDTLGGVDIAIVNDQDIGVVRAYQRNGKTLGEELMIQHGFWFAWSIAHPGTEIYLP